MKIEKKEINKRTLVIGGIALAVVLIAAIMIAEGVSGMKKKKTDVSEGLKIIEQAESADVTAIETKIGQLEAKDSQGQEDTRSLKEIFGSTVVMGDSISEGFAEFDVLNTSSVISKIGVELEELDEQVEQLVKVNPQVVFLTFGANDILATKGDEKAYIEQYKALIEKIQKSCRRRRSLSILFSRCRSGEWRKNRYLNTLRNITKRFGQCATSCRLHMWTTQNW